MSWQRSMYVITGASRGFGRIWAEAALRRATKSSRQPAKQDALAAYSAAERVVYSSPSQFSREFKRLFSVFPADEA